MTITIDTTTPRGAKPRLTVAMKRALAVVVRAYVDAHPDSSEDVLEGLRFLEDQAQTTPRKTRARKSKHVDLELGPLPVVTDVVIPEGVVAVIDGGHTILL